MKDELNNKEKRIYTKKNGEPIRRWTREEHEKYKMFIVKYEEEMKDSSAKR